MSYVALVTGASAGIGEATARRLAREPDSELVLVARRGERLRALADQLAAVPGGGPRPTVIAADLTDPDAHARIAEVVAAEHGALHLLVNNAGAAWRGAFADGGWANVARHMAVDFEAPVRLTEALLGLLHAAAREAPAVGAAADRRVAVVNVSSTAVWAGRPRAGSYGAAKAALMAWSESLRAEEAAHGVHVGLVMPGFVATEGFPQSELRARALTRRLVSTPEVVAEAILDAGPGGRAERYAPRWYGGLAAVRLLAPGLIRRAVGGGAFTPEAQPAGEPRE